MTMSWDQYDEQRQADASAAANLKKQLADKFVQAALPQGITRERAFSTILEGIDSMGKHASHLREESKDDKEIAALDAALQTLSVVLVGVMTTLAQVHEPLSFSN
jgi:hypothetical protein